MSVMSGQRAPMPRDVSSHVGPFDRFAGWAADLASRAPFFAFCVLLILLWAPTLAFMSLNTWQLLLNTLTAIPTFLLVALLQNSERRGDKAAQHKLNALTNGLAVLLEDISDRVDDEGIHEAIAELRRGTGLEQRETSQRESAPL